MNSIDFAEKSDEIVSIKYQKACLKGSLSWQM